LWTAGKLFAAAQEREVTYRYFSEALMDLDARQSIVDWAPATKALDRPFGPPEQISVGEAMTEAWQSFSVALDSADSGFLADHFTDVALVRATQAVEAGQGARMAVLEMTSRPEFHHDDGSVLQVATEAVVARYMGEQENLSFFDMSVDGYVTTLVNGAAGWKIAMHERSGAASLDMAPQSRSLPKLAGINYYPAQTPWSRFWPAMTVETLEADFDLIRGLGGNAIRIFLQNDAFTGDDLEENLRKLRLLLETADDNGLWVVPTLFDLPGGYETAYWFRDYQSLQRILPVLRDAPNVAYVDLKNEADLDFDQHGQFVIEAWARTMLNTARRYAPELLFTIGWAKAESALILADHLDVISYHEYGDPDEARQKLNQVLTKAGSKPVHITEIGATSFELVASMPNSPEKQAEEVGNRLRSLQDADGLFVWTLHDFPDLEDAPFGRSPWVRALQGEFGLYDATGTEKPAAAVVRAEFERLLENSDDD
jgi:hypothetical protein